MLVRFKPVEQIALIVKSPYPNHQDVLVEVLGPVKEDGCQRLLQEVRLTEGEEHQFFVYSEQTLHISEIERERTYDNNQ